ncbi:hypothetical protein AB0D34_35625 [Streptomyces sp. NPDC048420]|uniref:hypothetical protein n=1 Tax=Streptomyces sp. NPDC048420 TaxID=3155755 RepID=UPI0034193FEE
MAFTTYDTVRAQTQRLLVDADQPLTRAAVAAELDTSTNQAGRALRELERRGQAVRDKQAGQPSERGGRAPDMWSSASQ